jgi:O-antigen ligase/Flp pilus assembly protein TadD
LKRWAWILLGAALVLPGLALVPHSQHVFWLPESAVWLTLAPLAALAAWWSTRGEAAGQVPLAIKHCASALFCCWILSACLAQRPDLAAVSLAEWLCYPLIFYAVWRLASTPEARAAILALLIGYGVLSTGYGVMQVLGLDLDWSTHFGRRAGAFLGNPNFLGGHLSLLLPLSLALALDRRRQAQSPGRWLGAWVLVAMLGLGLLLTQTRGAWIGAALGMACVLWLASKAKSDLLRRNRKPLAILTAAAVLGLGGLLAATPGLGSRLSSITKDPEAELSGRLFLMRKAVQLTALKPWWGVGPGNIRIQFPRVQALGWDPHARPPQAYVVGEHAHNDFLQMAAEAGVPAALLWAALMLLVLGRLLRFQMNPALARDSQQGGLLVLGVLGALVALLVHGLANFPFLILPTQGTAWALAALALRSMSLPAASASAGLVEDASPGTVAWSAPSPHRFDGILFAMGLALCIFSALYNGRRLIADQAWWVGQGELELQHPAAAEPWLAKAVVLAPNEDPLWMLLGEAQQEQGELQQSLQSLQTAHRLAPYDPVVSARLGSVLLQNHQYAQAESILRPASAMAPNFAGLWGPLGAALYLQGKQAEAADAYDQWIRLGGDENAYMNKAAALGSGGHLGEALAVLKEAEQRYPDKPMIYANEAITYYKQGQRALARASLAKAQSLGLDAAQGAALQKALR